MLTALATRFGMRVEDHDGARLVIGGPVPPGYAAITIGSIISVRREHAGDVALIAHEMVHVDQWRRLGAPRFLWQYVGAYLGGRLRGHGHMAAYRRIPLEVEAEWYSGHDGLPLSEATGQRAAAESSFG